MAHSTKKSYRVEYIRDGVQTSIEIHTHCGPGWAVEEVFARHHADEVVNIVEL
jgi:hypothetical protein